MKRLTIRWWVIGVVAALVGCRTALGPAAGRDQAVANGSLAGLWTIVFRLDSVRAPGASPPWGWQRGSLREAQGRLRLTDSTAGGGVRSTIDVDFTPLLGQQISCFDPRPRTTGVERRGDTVTLRFTPAVADCGFGASGVLRGDLLIGSWEETSFIGPVSAGRFVMTRLAP